MPGVYLVAQTERSGYFDKRPDRGVFHATTLDDTSKHAALCSAQFSARPLLTRDASRMVSRRPCSRCYGPAAKTLVVLREDRAALRAEKES
ncbi:MAG: hypothetical protein NVS3B1_06320 [Marmoricola sp.]